MKIILIKWNCPICNKQNVANKDVLNLYQHTCYICNRKGKLITHVVFKNGSAPVSCVFKNKEEAQKKAQELQEKFDKDFK